MTINLRLDCVDELLSDSKLFFHCNEVRRCIYVMHCSVEVLSSCITQILRYFANLDRVISQIVVQPRTMTEQLFRRRIDTVLRLKDTLQQVRRSSRVSCNTCSDC